ncbi:hypothetical protein AB0M46_12900 [Dactylosporangium sp. NPDC051485]|uniref:hypothetical protein n=1 Tax=Dactylosporangium sp. NPDC051485 TaxID=3154846 RepID=UPI00344018F1
MNNWQWLAPVLTAMGVLGVVGQILVARQQNRLSRLQTLRVESARWANLRENWHLALLAAYGPGGRRRAGVTVEAAEDFRTSLQHVVSEGGRALKHANSDDFAQAQKSFEILNNSYSALIPYERAIEEVVQYLAGVCALVLENTIRPSDAYTILGVELVEHQDAVRRLLKISPEVDGCPGSQWGRVNRWQNLDLDVVANEIGWDDSLVAAVGTRSRTMLLLDMMAAHAIFAGDAGRIHGFDDNGPAMRRRKLLTIWATGQTTGIGAAFRASRQIVRANLLESRGLETFGSLVSDHLPKSPVWSRLRRWIAWNADLVKVATIRPTLRDLPRDYLFEYIDSRPVWPSSEPDRAELN